MNELNMEYNSNREPLIIPEYGRNVQKLIKHAKSIEDDEERQQFIEQVVDLMMQLSPQNRNLEDYRDKLWVHVFHIAGYDLDVTTPSGEIPNPEDVVMKPEKVNYPESAPKFRHYGNNVQHLIKKALEMEDGPIKDGFVNTIGNYMKLAYRTWNKDHYVSDDIIKDDLKSLSKGQLVLEDGTLDHLSNSNRGNLTHKRNEPRGRSNDRGRGRNDRGRGRNKGRRKH